jgi:hypothetical protein
MTDSFFSVYRANQCENQHSVDKDEPTDIFIKDCFIECNGAVTNSVDRY